ncbi:hypothetical protein HBI46_211780 [Parastagonospora nodorum]|nr:hypothetical protein HBH43_116510 [Parastagonospora nodorum]KAH5404005.1 hypothetical protein HBI46_211780 [Parastagonospora nodorum]KAH5507593.1 hypothetical protein HBI29_122940 [Parastagonospora nodorum]
MSAKNTTHWLDRYANNAHAWESSATTSGETQFKRPIGIVESFFDNDGTHYGGRADMTATFKLAIRHTLSREDLRKRVAAAWCLLRLNHVLLQSRVEEDENGKKNFVVCAPRSAGEAIQAVEKDMIWLEDIGFDDTLQELDLHHHALNVARIIQPEECLSRIHVLPLKKCKDGTWELRFLIVIAHQISDGLTAYNWFSHLIRILNTPYASVISQIETAIRPEDIKARLPSAQEDLYPAITGSPARQRWFWAIMRVLRHVQHTMPPTFANPLRRAERLQGPIPLPPTYARVFDYTPSSLPPLSSAHISASLSPAASARLIALCKSIHVSIGSGCFALAGLSMMAMHESRYADLASPVPAMGASFPLNPRAFFASNPPADSCMLAFSEGILMPFLPSSLPVEGRFKLIAKHANRELRVYQKRLKEGGQALGAFDKYSPARLLATGYIAQVERVESWVPEGRKTGVAPQGTLKPRVGTYGATCGVSSTGSLKAYFRPGEYDLNDDTKDFVADYRDLKMGVRARDNEFLIGSSTDAAGCVGFGVSYDENAISQEVAQKWAETIRGLLEPANVPKL